MLVPLVVYTAQNTQNIEYIDIILKILSIVKGLSMIKLKKR